MRGRVATSRGRCTAVAGVAFASGLALAACASAPRGTTVGSRGGVSESAPCPDSLRGALPRRATRWLFVRPVALLGDPGLATVVPHWLDADTVSQLDAYATRTGLDPRRLDRIAAAWDGQSAVFMGAGPFDDPQALVERLWDRLLEPRARHELGANGTAIEGVLADRPVALVVRPRCHVAALGQGSGRGVAEAILRAHAPAHVASSGALPVSATTTTDDPPPDVLLEWSGTGVPFAPDDAAARSLVADVTHWTLSLARSPDGAAVTVTADGHFAGDAAPRVTAVLDALVRDPLGDLTGAADWLATDRRQLAVTPSRLQLRLAVPSRALAALVDVLHGHLPMQPDPEDSAGHNP